MYRQRSLVMLFTYNVKKNKGAAHKYSDDDDTSNGSFVLEPKRK